MAAPVSPSAAQAEGMGGWFGSPTVSGIGRPLAGTNRTRGSVRNPFHSGHRARSTDRNRCSMRSPLVQTTAGNDRFGGIDRPPGALARLSAGVPLLGDGFIASSVGVSSTPCALQPTNETMRCPFASWICNLLNRSPSMAGSWPTNQSAETEPSALRQ